MVVDRLATSLPRPLWALLAVFTLASLIHFAHNAEYIAFYPNMPAWLTREQVYAVWLALASLGVAGVLCAWARWRVAAGALLALYGATGLDGLGHYTLALCSEHTLAMNLTIGFEAIAGVALAVGAARMLLRPRAAPAA